MTTRKNTKNKIIVIVGPTASGKSELAVQIAKKYNGEIISADSQQVYKGLDIGTGKVKTRLNKRKKIYMYKSIPHYGIDLVSLPSIFSAGEFKIYGEKTIKDILARHKTPIIVGGTGFWIDSLVYDFNLPEVPPDAKLRKKLSQKNTKELFKILKKLDLARAGNIDKFNPRRLIRAIEIAKSMGRVPILKKKIKYDARWIGLNPSKKSLQKNIEKRVRGMLKKNGILAEVKKLLAQKITKTRIKELGFEYKTVLDYLGGLISKKDLENKLVRESLQYAKRQMRWFKRNKEINWQVSI